MKIFKGCIIHTPDKEQFDIHQNSYLIVEDDVCSSIVPAFLDEWRDGIENGDIEYFDYHDHLIIPSFIDLHLHAPQFIQMGVGLHLPLIDWLNQYTFKIEERFADVNYARKCYPSFVKDLYDWGSLRSVIFGTIHNESNRVLVDLLAELGLCALVGKVNMNRFTTVGLTETTDQSLSRTNQFINWMETEGNSQLRPIVTPRFAPSCSEDLMRGLGDISQERSIPVQSHLCETKREMDWVKDLYKDMLTDEEGSYSDVYAKTGLLGEQPTVMAHGVYLEERDIELCRNKNVWIAHCPTSNMNLSSGIMPLTRYLDTGLRIGLGSDIGAGHTLAMNQVMVSAIENAKMRHTLFGDRMIMESEVFYLCTKGNGSFFEAVFNDVDTVKGSKAMKRIGSFEKGYSFDALIIQEEHPVSGSLTPLEQLQRFLYCGDKHSIKKRYLDGKEL